jgi:hypothetical protein
MDWLCSIKDVGSDTQPSYSSREQGVGSRESGRGLRDLKARKEQRSRGAGEAEEQRGRVSRVSRGANLKSKI